MGRSEREPVLLEPSTHNPTGMPTPCGRGAGGSGITRFGGYSMKSSDNMLPMKSDMGGPPW